MTFPRESSIVTTRDANGRRSRVTLTPPRITKWLRSMAGCRVAVIGDAILDEFLWGDATRISPEAPVPVVLLDHQSWSLGGAANVAANIVALGGHATLFSAIGGDAAGERLQGLLAATGIDIGALPVMRDRPTTVKHRVFARSKHLLRFDREEVSSFPEPVSRALLGALAAAIAEFDCIVVSDYAKGCVTAALVRGLIRLIARRATPWCADPKGPDIRYRNATVLKPNLAELEILSGIRVRSLDDLHRAAARTLRSQHSENLLVTRGREGMLLFGLDGSITSLPGGGQQVSDVTGAGDTVTAALALGLAAGLSVIRSAAVANLAGGYVVTIPGITVARQQDILDELR